MTSNLHICYYQYHSLRRVSSPFTGCLQVVFDYKHFLTTINYFQRLYTTYRGRILLSTPIYYFCDYVLLLTAIDYFRWLYFTFHGQILPLALPDCDFIRIQDFPAISSICGLKARLEFSINFLALIQFCVFCSSIISSINFNVLF